MISLFLTYVFHFLIVEYAKAQSVTYTVLLSLSTVVLNSRD